MADMERIEKLLAGCSLAGPVDEEMISSAETKLGTRFPKSYRTFLSRFGAAVCSGFEIAGLFRQSNSEEAPFWSSVLSMNEQLRRVSGNLIPMEYIAISDDGGDYTYYLDTSRLDAAFECPVIVLGPGADGPIVAKDFFDFVIRACDNTLSFEPT